MIAGSGPLSLTVESLRTADRPSDRSKPWNEIGIASRTSVLFRTGGDCWDRNHQSADRSPGKICVVFASYPPSCAKSASGYRNWKWPTRANWPPGGQLALSNA